MVILEEVCDYSPYLSEHLVQAERLNSIVLFVILLLSAITCVIISIRTWKSYKRSNNSDTFITFVLHIIIIVICFCSSISLIDNIIYPEAAIIKNMLGNKF